MKNEFLKKLADLCEQYNVGFSYTNDDDGVHIVMDGEDIAVGGMYVSESAVATIRAAMDSE